MYTQCPGCATVFAVRPDQLDAAGGRVRCGACGKPFDALLYLVEDLPAVPPAAEPGRRTATGMAPAAPARDPRPPPQAEVPATGAGGQGPAQTLAPAEPHPGAAGPLAAAGSHLGAPASAPAPVRPRPRDHPEPRPALASARIPEPLQADLAAAARRASVLGRFGRLLAVSVLLVLLVLQIAWLAPAQLLARAPFAQPWVERLGPWFDAASAAIGWERAPPRDLGRIRVLERDIREHPTWPGALLVHATLLNAASFRQPAPRVRLTLFDVNGAVIARRAFEPREYLAGGGPALEIPSAGLVQVRLELLAPASPAVSYQIEFL